ncbi:MAG TPA: hypothetical protein VE642_04140, partial [Pyrinomonadaceae bacterium]|nr:hypothetical protein [Pyrinomonadaceae bacterium]
EGFVEARPSASFGFAAARPAFSALASERGALLPTVEHALSRYVAECDPALYEPSGAGSTRAAALRSAAE